MISRNQISLIKSLDRKKYRQAEKCFVAEGVKIVREVLDLPGGGPFKVRALFCTESWLKEHGEGFSNPPDTLQEITDHELLKISHLTTPNQVLALIDLPEQSTFSVDFERDLILGLEQVQDPGNCGTLIRLAEWFGLSGMVFSPDCADIYSPKVVQASMGSIFRIQLMECDLQTQIRSWPESFPIYGTRLDGENMYSAKLTPHGMILMGNESRGLSPNLSSLVSKSLKIPDFSASGSIDSLNVAIAGALVCSEFKRRASA